jgi:hypothetical protein
MSVTFDERVLPKHLANIITAFSEWTSAKIDERCQVDVVDAPVFHYTTSAGLEGILGSGFIRLTDLGQMADDSEFQYGSNFALDALSEAYAGAAVGISDAATVVRCFCDATPSILSEVGPKAGRFHFYSASFCGRGDDAFLWQEYAAKGAGFALKLAHELFADPPAGVPLTVMDRIFRILMLYDRDEAIAAHCPVQRARRTRWPRSRDQNRRTDRDARAFRSDERGLFPNAAAPCRPAGDRLVHPRRGTKLDARALIPQRHLIVANPYRSDGSARKSCASYLPNYLYGLPWSPEASIMEST